MGHPLPAGFPSYPDAGLGKETLKVICIPLPLPPDTFRTSSSIYRESSRWMQLFISFLLYHLLLPCHLSVNTLLTFLHISPGLPCPCLLPLSTQRKPRLTLLPPTPVCHTGTSPYSSSGCVVRRKHTLAFLFLLVFSSHFEKT